MKKTILTILVFCFAVFSVSAQVENKKTEKVQESSVGQSKTTVAAKQIDLEEDNPNAPVLSFEKLVHDYGTMAQNADGNCEFKFTNNGREPLILSNVRSSWGCTTPAWPRKPVLPGESEVIVVRYNTKKVGAINKSIQVYSNAKKSPIVLKIKGRVEAATATVLPEKKANSSVSPVNK